MIREEPIFDIDEVARRVVWRVWRSPPFHPLPTPWGTLRRGEETGQGVVLWVEAEESFDLIAEGETVTLYESISPGRHRYVLTLLDSTDVVG